MAWTFVRPVDPSVLSGRPLLDIGTGDGQTLGALAPDGFGVDREIAVLSGRSRVAAAEAVALPFRRGAFGCVLAGDLFHHLDDESLAVAAAEARKVLAPGGRLVAWWYEAPGLPSPDAPRFPRTLEAARRIVAAAGFETNELGLVMELDAGPRTVGLVATPTVSV